MNLPINTTADGAAFAVKSGERACFANMTNGGGNFPETSVIVVYQLCGRMREDGSRPLPQGVLEQLPRHWVEQDACNGRHRDMGGVI